MVQRSVHSLLVKEDIRKVGTTSPTLHVAAVAPNLLPFWSPEESKEKPHGHQGVPRIYFIPISYVATYPGCLHSRKGEVLECAYRSTE